MGISVHLSVNSTFVTTQQISRKSVITGLHLKLSCKFKVDFYWSYINPTLHEAEIKLYFPKNK
jgi:hypothetical protein